MERPSRERAGIDCRGAYARHTRGVAAADEGGSGDLPPLLVGRVRRRQDWVGLHRPDDVSHVALCPGPARPATAGPLPTAVLAAYAGGLGTSPRRRTSHP